MRNYRGKFMLVTILIVVAMGLYKTGKGYEVYLTSTLESEDKEIENIEFSIEGEKKIVKIREGKKSVIQVKGREQKFVVRYKEEGKVNELKGEFKIGNSKEVELNLGKFIEKNPSWIKMD